MSDQKSLAIVPRTVDEVRTLAAQFAKSALLPPDLRGKEADVFVTILAGQELGLPPMAALRGIHVVKGKPVLSADSMVGVALRSGLAEYFSCVEENATSVTYETKRRGSPHPQRCTWTMDDARQAQLGGDNWKRYPRAMLKARCKAALARDVYPDVLAGCYDDDEARDFAPAASVVPLRAPVDAVDAEIVSETRTEPAGELSPVDMIDRAETEAALVALAPQLARLRGAARDEARAAYKARMAQLRAGSTPAVAEAQS